jgi:hypothetical protein
MDRKVFVSDYASLMESKTFPDAKRTFTTMDADIFVNPEYGAIYDKTVIVNLPVEIPLEQLRSSNKVISRFPIGYDIPVIPYDVPEDKKCVKKSDYSCIILNPSMMTEMKYAKCVKDNDFLIGISETIDGEASLIGLKIGSTTVEN